MALVNKISSGARIDTSGQIIYVKDLTGNYGETSYVKDLDDPTIFSALVNATGYGAPNAIRSAVALFLIAQVKKTDGDVLVKANQLTNPTTGDEFEVYPTEDGWYRFSLVRLDVVASPIAVSYEEGNAVYDSTLGAIVQLIDGVFTEIEPAKLIGTSYIKATNDKAFVANYSKLLIEIDSKKNNAIMNRGAAGDIEDYQKKYDKVAGILRGSCNAYMNGEKAVFQKNIEWLSNNKHCLC